MFICPAPPRRGVIFTLAPNACDIFSDIVFIMSESSPESLNARAVKDNEILVVNKCDTCGLHEKSNAIYVSAKTGAGVDTLIRALKTRVNEIGGGQESELMINARTYDLVKTAANELESALSVPDTDYDILAEHIKYAADAIGKILGQIETNEILDITFSQLCLGK